MNTNRKVGRKSQGPPPGFESLSVNTNPQGIQNTPPPPVLITYNSAPPGFYGYPIYHPSYPPPYYQHYMPRSPRNSPVVVYHHGPPVQYNRSVVSPNGSPNGSPNSSPTNRPRQKPRIVVVNSKDSSNFDYIYGCFETCPNSKGRPANYGIVENCCTNSFKLDIKTSGIVREFIVSIGAHGSNNLFFPSAART